MAGEIAAVAGILAFVALFAGARRISLVLAGAYLAFALAAGRIQPLGLVWLALLGAAAWAYYERKMRLLGATALTALAFALSFHAAPGFANRELLDRVRVTPDAIPYDLWINYDKPPVGYAILWFAHRPMRSWRELAVFLKRLAIVIPFGLAFVLLPSLLSGYVAWSPKLPWFTGIFVLHQLFSVCTAEEGFFRAFAQEELTKRAGFPAAVLVASAVFGLAHAAGGPVYVVLSAIAGLFYGTAYARTGRVEGSILAHASLNVGHFLLLTYPGLERAVTS